MISISLTVIKEAKEELNSVVKMYISVRFSFSTNSKSMPMFLGFCDKFWAKMDEGTFFGESCVNFCNII